MALIASMAIRIIVRFTEQINTCDVFFRVGRKKKLDVFFPPKKPQMSAGRWWAG
jgi:hypothetical protein